MDYGNLTGHPKIKLDIIMHTYYIPSTDIMQFDALLCFVTKFGVPTYEL